MNHRDDKPEKDVHMCNKPDDNCNGANCGALETPANAGDRAREGVAVSLWDDGEGVLVVRREPDGAVRLEQRSCGAEAVIPPGMWDALFTMPPCVMHALRAAAGPWPPPSADEPEGASMRFTLRPAAEGECRVVVTDDGVFLEPHLSVIAAMGCGPDELEEIALVVGLDVALEATSDPTRFRVRFYEGGRLAGELVDVPVGVLTAT